MCQCLPLNNSCWCRGLWQSFGIIAQLRINQGWTTKVTWHWSGQSNTLCFNRLKKGPGGAVVTAVQDIKGCCHCWARYQKLLPVLGKISKAATLSVSRSHLHSCPGCACRLYITCLLTSGREIIFQQQGGVFMLQDAVSL